MNIISYSFFIHMILFNCLYIKISNCMEAIKIMQDLSPEELIQVIAPWKGKQENIKETIEKQKNDFLYKFTMESDFSNLAEHQNTSEAQFDLYDQTVIVSTDAIKVEMAIAFFLTKLSEQKITVQDKENQKNERKKRCSSQ